MSHVKKHLFLMICFAEVCIMIYLSVRLISWTPRFDSTKDMAFSIENATSDYTSYKMTSAQSLENKGLQTVGGGGFFQLTICKIYMRPVC